MMICSFNLAFLLTIFYSILAPSMTTPTLHLDYSQPTTSHSMNSSELEALYQVMDAIAGNINWRVLHPRPCSENMWPGVVCEQGDDGLLHVTRLDFGYKPNPTCMVNATFPPEISGLTSLQSLFIFECFTTYNTTIPSQLKHLSQSLQELSLRTNPSLVGEIPPEVGLLSSLQILSLSQNSLFGSIPPQIGKLSNLEHLDLSFNMLSGMLPKEIGSLKNLVILDLSVNSLMGPIPASIGDLFMVQKMDLSSNSFTGAVPAEIGNLQNLQFLSMSDNALTGPLPDSFTNFSSLQYLIMDNNPMNGPLPSFLCQFPSILALTFSNSGYVGMIPEEVGSLANLSVLSLDRNNLTGPIPTGLGNLPHIYALNLSQNSLTGPVPFSPAFVHKLGRNLDLDGNAGLCSHWQLPQNTTGETIRLCSELSGSGYPVSSSSSSAWRVPCPMLFLLIFCNLSMWMAYMQLDFTL